MFPDPIVSARFFTTCGHDRPIRGQAQNPAPDPLKAAPPLRKIPTPIRPL